MSRSNENRSKRRWWRGRAKKGSPTPTDGYIAENPTLRAVSESGVIWDDPSVDLLFELLSDLEHDVELFFIVNRVRHEDFYIQVLMQEDRTYLVEHRAGDASTHYGAVCADKRLVHDVLVQWGLLSTEFKDALDWSPVAF